MANMEKDLMNMSDSSGRGKKSNQKLKPYAVLQFLLKNTDEDHLVDAFDIIAFLDDCGIEAERRSIYQDIKEINKVALMLQQECSIDEADEMLDADDDDTLKLVKYDKSRKGFYVQNSMRQFDLNDIRLIAECVYSAKFIAEGQAKRLVEHVICDFVSTHQSERIRHDALLTDRVKTNNRAVLNSISVINEAMSTRMNGKSHQPQKIAFKYLKYSIDDLHQQIERRKGHTYTVSPYKLIINDGNYYLLAYNGERKQIWTYRIDRMKDVRLIDEAREGEEEYRKLDIRTFVQRTVSMFSGKRERVTIRFIMSLLDAVIDEFGTSSISYKKLDNHHFSMTAEVDVSEPFFSWLMRFGKSAKILSPDSVVEQFSAYLDRVRAIYNKPAGD